VIDTTKVLEIAEFETRGGSAVPYPPFYILKPPDEEGWHFLFKVKRILLDNGYVCHERRHLGEWWNLCGYKEKKTHFHRKEDLSYIKS